MKNFLIAIENMKKINVAISMVPGPYLFEKVAMTQADLQDICAPSVDYFASLLYKRGPVSSLLKDIKIPSICVRSLFSR